MSHRPGALWLPAYAFLAVMLGTTLPTPLYPRYEQRWGFSALTITVIFAVYALGVIAALLLLGGLSDQVGRRPALLASLILSAASAVAFLLAGGLGALLAGRALSGFSAGICTGTATAAVVDLAPAGRQSYGSGIATAVNLGGLGCGTLLAGLLAAVGLAPLRLPFWVDLGLLGPAFAAVARMPETVLRPGRTRLTVQRLRIPRQLRTAFAQAAAAGFASFAMSGLFSSVAPTFLAAQLHHPSPALAGAVVFAVFTTSAAGQLVVSRVPGRAGLPAGCAGIIAGAALTAAALGADSLGLLIAGAVVVGAGQGFAVGAGLTMLTAGTPAGQRGEVASSYFVAAYVGLSIPIIGVGLLSTVTDLRTAAFALTGLVAVLTAASLLSLARNGFR